jgi:hypothetical protein
MVLESKSKLPSKMAQMQAARAQGRQLGRREGGDATAPMQGQREEECVGGCESRARGNARGKGRDGDDIADGSNGVFEQRADTAS